MASECCESPKPRGLNTLATRVSCTQGVNSIPNSLSQLQYHDHQVHRVNSNEILISIE
jgi:hypothetical protein